MIKFHSFHILVRLYIILVLTWIGISVSIVAKKLGISEYQLLKYSLLSVFISNGTTQTK